MDIIQGVELRGHEGLAIDIVNPICGVIGIVVQNGRIRIAEMYEPAVLLGDPFHKVTHPFKMLSEVPACLVLCDRYRKWLTATLSPCDNITNHLPFMAKTPISDWMLV